MRSAVVSGAALPSTKGPICTPFVTPAAAACIAAGDAFCTTGVAMMLVVRGLDPAWFLPIILITLAP